MLTIISRSQAQVTLRKSASTLWLKTGQQCLNPTQKTRFILDNTITGNSIWIVDYLPVFLMKTCRVESLQQEMGHYVEGILVWFVEHIPAGHATRYISKHLPFI